MIKIIPVPIGYPAKQANRLEVRILPFQTDATTCSTYYELVNVTEVEITPASEDGNTPAVMQEVTTRLAEGNYTLTEEEYAAWGDDNAVVEDAVIAYLQLERVAE